jgi:hypothetical protein
MWLFTEKGFVSAVQHRDDSNYLMVRARDRVSLEALADYSQADIKVSPEGDYPYRVTVAKNVFANWVQEQIEILDYPNFKNQVAVTRGKSFASILSGVWSVMLKAEDDESHEARRAYDSGLGFATYR